MSILSEYLEKRSMGERRGKFAELKQIAAELEEVLLSDAITDEEKYELTFWTNSEKVQPILKELSLRLEYYDPDTTYMEDSWAYVNALKEFAT